MKRILFVVGCLALLALAFYGDPSAALGLPAAVAIAGGGLWSPFDTSNPYASMGAYDIGDSPEDYAVAADMLGDDPIDSLLQGNAMLGALLGNGNYNIGAQQALARQSLSPVALARMQQQAMIQAAANATAATKVPVGQLRPSKSYEWPLGGFDLVIVAAATSDVIARPQVPFRGERLVIPRSIAPDFLIVDVRCGNQSVFAASGAVPAEVFANDSVGVRMKMFTVQQAMDMAIRANNIAAADRRFLATVLGTCIALT